MRALSKYLVSGLVSAALGIMPASAADYPSHPIRLIVPFAPGGSIDIVARVIAPGMSELLGQPVAVENRTGASGYIGADVAAKAAPDGHTIILHGLPLATQRHLTKSLPVDPLIGFAGITTVALQPNVLVVHPSIPANTTLQLIDYAKKNPGKLNFASSGPGATQHLAAELLKGMTGIDIVHVPYQGGGASMPDLLSGRVQMMIETAPGAMRYIKSGQLRALGVTSKQRLPALPDVPTIDQAGVPGYELAGWLLLLAPAKTPPEIITKLHDTTIAVMKRPDIAARLHELGLEVGGGTSAETMEFLRKETDRYGQLIRSVGISPN
jgi:tripartite-type tricarboxylate transporter receptor subunit TctC